MSNNQVLWKSPFTGYRYADCTLYVVSKHVTYHGTYVNSITYFLTVLLPGNVFFRCSNYAAYGNLSRSKIETATESPTGLGMYKRMSKIFTLKVLKSHPQCIILEFFGMLACLFVWLILILSPQRCLHKVKRFMR